LVKFDGTSNFTGVTVTNHATLVGAASNGVTSLALGTSGQVLTSAGAGSDPAYQTITTGILPGSGQITLSNGTNISVTGSPVALGGTATINVSGPITPATYTAHGVVIGNGSSALNVTSAGTSGQVLTSNGSSSDPTFQALPVGAVVWSVITMDQSIVANNGYICNKAGLLTLTLPASSSIGDVFEITGINTALGWKIAQNANQQIFSGTNSTTVGVTGSIASINIRDSIRCVCVVSGASSVWNVISAVGNLTIA
jgi:hypothetical protein